jgi:redox-sensitive bicupin YhaK (pirin superfamily)
MKVIAPRLKKISSEFEIKRILPYREQRMVGPFCFLDHMGPVIVDDSGNQDVLSHPHIGLATLTYLFSGSLFHRDSLGSEQVIEPGDVNLMIAGSGIAHSEKVVKQRKEIQVDTSELHGLQSWIALPKGEEDCEPSFHHYSQDNLPQFDWNRLKARLIMGEFAGKTSPVSFPWRSLYCHFVGESGTDFSLQAAEEQQALYFVNGGVEVNGQSFDDSILIYFEKDEVLRIRIFTSGHIVLFGGQRLPEGRFIDWNFVSSDKEKILAAKQKWKSQTFPKVPGEAGFVPLPD